jgi:hypothetical protein
MSLKLQEEYGEDLQVLFVEAQVGDEAQMTAFALEKGWFGGRAMWTTESPFRLDLKGIPQFGLLGPDGELVLSGHTTAMTSQIDDTIEELVKAARKGPQDVPKNVAKALREARDGDFAKALGILDGVLADERAAEDHPAAQAARDDVIARIDRALARAAWLLDHGYPLQAVELFEKLEKGLKDAPHGTDALGKLAERFGSDAVEAELDAGKALAKLEQTLYADGPSEKAQKKLIELSQKHAGTKVAERANELARIAG